MSTTASLELLGREFARQQVRDGYALVVASRQGSVIHIKAVELVGRHLEFRGKAVGLGVFLVDRIGKGGYAAPIRQVYPQDAVAQHAVRVVHGVYVALGRDRAQGIIRLLV